MVGWFGCMHVTHNPNQKKCLCSHCRRVILGVGGKVVVLVELVVERVVVVDFVVVLVEVLVLVDVLVVVVVVGVGAGGGVGVGAGAS